MHRFIGEWGYVKAVRADTGFVNSVLNCITTNNWLFVSLSRFCFVHVFRNLYGWDKC